NTQATGWGRFGYAGMPFDTETGLYRTSNRMYNPGTAQWLQEDSLGFDAGDSNLRRYVGNDATNATDSSGTEEKSLAQMSVAELQAKLAERKEFLKTAYPEYSRYVADQIQVIQGELELRQFKATPIDLDVIPAERIQGLIKDGVLTEWKG